jgi:hypothetical protein
MSIEALLWGILPAIVALCAVFVSLLVAFRARRILHFAVSGIVIAAVTWSLLILYRIFALDAWPTYWPHVTIGVVLITVIAQTIRFRNRRHDAA